MKNPNPNYVPPASEHRDKPDVLLVFKVKMFIRDDDMEKIRQKILRQIPSGVVIIPDYVECVVEPKDIDVIVEQYGP